MSNMQIPDTVIGLLAIVFLSLFAFLKSKEDAESAAFRALLEGHLKVLSGLDGRFAEVGSGLKAIGASLVELIEKMGEFNARLARLERGQREKDEDGQAELSRTHQSS